MRLNLHEKGGHWLDPDDVQPDTEVVGLRASALRRGDVGELRDLLERHAITQLELEQPPVGLIKAVMDGRPLDYVVLQDLRGFGIGDELAACRGVRSLVVSGAVSGQHLAHLDGAVGLEELDLSDTRVLWRDLVLRSFPALRRLTLGSVPLFDDQDYAAAVDRVNDGPTLARELCARRWPDRVSWPWDLPFRDELDRLPETVQDLEPGPPVKPPAREWARLARRVLDVPAETPDMPELVWLGLPKCVVPSTLIAAVAKLPKLRVLDLNLTGVQHDELAPLLGHPTLRKVNLDRSVHRDDLEAFVQTGIKPRW
jgi:hypothetical protein